MSSIPNLNNLASIARLGRGKATGKKIFRFNGSTGYIQQVGYSGGVVRKQNDGSRDYWQCYGGYFNIGDSAVHGLDNRSVQTMKFVGQLDNILNIQILASYASQGGSDIHTSGAVRVYLPGTGSITISSTTTITPGAIYNVIVRINNTLPSGTARVVGDADIFISGTKSGTSFVTGSNNTANTSNLGWGGSTTGAQPTYGRLYNFSLWNRALSDAECQAEGLNNRSVVTPSGLVNTWDTTDTSQAISRTGYNLNVSGNVTTGTDADGKYILIDGNRDGVGATGTLSNIGAVSGLTPTYNQTTSFTIKVRLKHITNPATGVSGFFGSSNDACIWVDGSGNIQFTVRGSTTVTYGGSVLTAGVLYDAYLVRDATQTKFFAYVGTAGGASSLINSGGTTGPTTFSTDGRCVGDAAVGTGSFSSSKKQIYHTRIRARALTQSEINADIALGNNTNNDPTIVASYRPDNLINWQGTTNPTTFGGTGWTIGSNATATINNATAPDGTTTATTYGINVSGTALTNSISQNVTTLTGSSLASKTFIVKAFVRVTSGSNAFRLRCGHTGVAEYYSTNQVATTTRQEFTFTQAFTSSTSGTGITAGLTSDTTFAPGGFEVRNVRVFLVNEILYDNSPNIGGYVGPLVNRYISGRIKPGVDALNDASGNPILNLGYGYVYIRNTNNAIRIRYDAGMGSAESTRVLGTGFRDRTDFIGGIERDGTNFRLITIIGGSKVVATQFLSAAHIINPQVQAFLGRLSSRYFTGSMRDMRIFTSPTSLTDAQALMITNGGDPMDITKVLHRDAIPSDTTNYVTDKSGNGRVGYITGGVTKTF